MQENRQKAPEIDMSPEAIDQRLRDLAQLWKLGMELQSARWIGTAAEIEERERARADSDPLPAAIPKHAGS